MQRHRTWGYAYNGNRRNEIAEFSHTQRSPKVVCKSQQPARNNKQKNKNDDGNSRIQMIRQWPQ